MMGIREKLAHEREARDTVLRLARAQRDAVAFVNDELRKQLDEAKEERDHAVALHESSLDCGNRELDNCPLLPEPCRHHVESNLLDERNQARTDLAEAKEELSMTAYDLERKIVDAEAKTAEVESDREIDHRATEEWMTLQSEERVAREAAEAERDNALENYRLVTESRLRVVGERGELAERVGELERAAYPIVKSGWPNSSAAFSYDLWEALKEAVTPPPAKGGE